MSDEERRKSKRYEPPNMTYATLRPKSGGVIVGQVKNISKGGLLLEYLENGLPTEDMEGKTDIFIAGTDIRLTRIEYRVAHDFEVTPKHYFLSRPIILRRCGLEFVNLDEVALNLLDYVFAQSEIGPE
jgi:hypothetical protein